MVIHSKEYRKSLLNELEQLKLDIKGGRRFTKEEITEDINKIIKTLKIKR